MATRTATETRVDINKAFIWVSSILIALLGWFGNIIYDKVTKIEDNVQLLLIASGIDKAEIQNLKERINTAPKPNRPISYISLSKEFITPKEVKNERKKYITLK